MDLKTLPLKVHTEKLLSKVLKDMQEGRYQSSLKIVF